MVRGKNKKANLLKIKVRSIWLCLSMSWKFNIVATPDQQQAPSFAQDEQKASLGVLLTVVKCEI